MIWDHKEYLFKHLVGSLKEADPRDVRKSEDSYSTRFNPVSRAVVSMHYDPRLRSNKVYVLSHVQRDGGITTYVSGCSDSVPDKSCRITNNQGAKILQELYENIQVTRQRYMAMLRKRRSRARNR